MLCKLLTTTLKSKVKTFDCTIWKKSAEKYCFLLRNKLTRNFKVYSGVHKLDFKTVLNVYMN